MSDKNYTRLVAAAGVFTGFICALGLIDAKEQNAYRDGRSAGYEEAIAKCAGPSRLERAAKWVSK